MGALDWTRFLKKKMDRCLPGPTGPLTSLFLPFSSEFAKEESQSAMHNATLKLIAETGHHIYFVEKLITDVDLCEFQRHLNPVTLSNDLLAPNRRHSVVERRYHTRNASRYGRFRATAASPTGVFPLAKIDCYSDRAVEKLTRRRRKGSPQTQTQS